MNKIEVINKVKVLFPFFFFFFFLFAFLLHYIILSKWRKHGRRNKYTRVSYSNSIN